MVKLFHSFYRFSSNVYVVHSEKGTILIDPGYYDPDIKKYLMGIGGLDAILLTHGHWDHICGLDSLKADRRVSHTSNSYTGAHKGLCYVLLYR